MKLGTIHKIFRYPVKSMMGEELYSSIIVSNGVLLDRHWALRDCKTMSLLNGKKLPEIMKLKSMIADNGGDAPHANIMFPDGSVVGINDANISKKLSDFLDKKVYITSLDEGSAVKIKKKSNLSKDDQELIIRNMFGRTIEEPLPDLSGFSPDIFRYESPPGTFFDAYPIHILTNISLNNLTKISSCSLIHEKRFRPNIVIKMDYKDSSVNNPEKTWIGKCVRAGEAIFRICLGAPRCSMVTAQFSEFPKDTSIMRNLVSNFNGEFGVYAEVLKPGTIRSGDAVELISSHIQE